MTWTHVAIGVLAWFGLCGWALAFIYLRRCLALEDQLEQLEDLHGDLYRHARK